MQASTEAMRLEENASQHARFFVRVRAQQPHQASQDLQDREEASYSAADFHHPRLLRKHLLSKGVCQPVRDGPLQQHHGKGQVRAS